MATSVREQIKQNLLTTLRGILVPGAFDITAKTVSQKLRHWDEIPSVEMPYLCVVSGDEEYPYVTERTIRTRMFPIIWAILKETDELDTELNALIHAVRQAVLVDKKRNDLATITYIRRTLTDEGVFWPFAVARFELEIEYYQDDVR